MAGQVGLAVSLGLKCNPGTRKQKVHTWALESDCLQEVPVYSLDPRDAALVWLVSGWAYLRPSAKKMIFLSSTAEAKIWIICSKRRQCSRTLKSTCSRWESRGRVSEMNYRKTRKKGFSKKRNHRPRAGLSHCFPGTDLILAHPSVASFCYEDSGVKSSLMKSSEVAHEVQSGEHACPHASLCTVLSRALLLPKARPESGFSCIVFLSSLLSFSSRGPPWSS